MSEVEERTDARVDPPEPPLDDDAPVVEPQVEPAAEVHAEASPEGSSGSGAVEEEAPPTEEELRERDARLEAVLFSSEVPLSTQKLRHVLGGTNRQVLASVDRLNVFYGETGRAFRISPLAGGFQIVTVPEHAELLGKLHKERVPTRLSRAALETLSIIAFKQPVTRGEIDAIRGVSASDRVLRHLIERKLVRISGRAEAPGRPLLYGTTREFLAYFGLSAVSDLPRTDELEALLAGDVPASATDDEDPQEPASDERPAPGEPVEEPGADGAIEGMMERSHAHQKSHSGEESDEHEGPPAPE